MPDRENILHKTRTALGRRGGEPPERVPSLPPAPRGLSAEERLERFLQNFSPWVQRAESLDHCRRLIAEILAGRGAVALNHPALDAAGVLSLPGVQKDFADSEALRAACASAEAGVSSPSYALAEPGALVVFSTGHDDRLVSLLPPAHIAIVEAKNILSSLDELFEVTPDPALLSSSMVLIGGPSRTGDIEMTMVQGVHGPGELHVIVV